MRCRYCHNPDTWRMADGDDEAVSVDELLDKAERYRAYWGEDGGITVSGGEALLQIDGLIGGVILAGIMRTDVSPECRRL